MNPQWMSFSEVQTGNDTATGGSVQPPVSLSTGTNLAMEILKIVLSIPNPPAAGTASQVTFWLSTKNFGTTAPTLGMGDSTVIIQDSWTNTLATSGATIRNQLTAYDFSDGAGHGVLVGNQNLYWGIVSATTSAANRVGCKILYRAKRISDSELLGIVLQSNQN